MCLEYNTSNTYERGISMRSSNRKPAASKTTYSKKATMPDNKNNNILNRSDSGIVCDFFDLGDVAPDFTLPGIVDNNPVDVTLSDYKGKWVLLFFYGSDFTFV